PADVIGPSVAAFGVGAGSTGTRADLLICDDVVDVRSLHNASERGRVADYFENNLMNLLEPDGRFWGLFTPWHGDDLNARLKKNASFKLFRRAIGSDFEPVWPEKWGPERLRVRKEEIGSAAFARGYRLVPMAEEDTPIRAEWVRLWTDARRRDAPRHLATGIEGDFCSLRAFRRVRALWTQMPNDDAYNCQSNRQAKSNHVRMPYFYLFGIKDFA